MLQFSDFSNLITSQERQQFHLEQLRAAEFRARSAAAAQLSRENPQVIGATAQQLPPQQSDTQQPTPMAVV